MLFARIKNAWQSFWAPLNPYYIERDAIKNSQIVIPAAYFKPGTSITISFSEDEELKRRKEAEAHKMMADLTRAQL